MTQLMDFLFLLYPYKHNDHDYEDSRERGLGSLFLFNVHFLILFFSEGAFSSWRNCISKEHRLVQIRVQKKGKETSNHVLGLLYIIFLVSGSQGELKGTCRFSSSLTCLINLNGKIAKNSGVAFWSRVNTVHLDKILQTKYNYRYSFMPSANIY